MYICICCTYIGPLTPSPVDLTVRDIFDTTISGVSWTAPSDDPVCGPISYDVKVSPSDEVTIMSINDTYYDITGLTPATSYNITVIGSNMAGAVELMMMVDTLSSNETAPHGILHNMYYIAQNYGGRTLNDICQFFTQPNQLRFLIQLLIK